MHNFAPCSQDFLNGVCTHIIWLTQRKLTYYTGEWRDLHTAHCSAGWVVGRCPLIASLRGRGSRGYCCIFLASLMAVAVVSCVAKSATVLLS
jgi:hypothetical protein